MARRGGNCLFCDNRISLLGEKAQINLEDDQTLKSLNFHSDCLIGCNTRLLERF